MYLDSAYLAKFYVNERDSEAVRKLIRGDAPRISSAWALNAVTCVFHRHMREGSLNEVEFRELFDAFIKHIDGGVWTLIPATERLLRRTALLVRSAPPGVYLRAGDALHLATALDAGERGVWTNDRHLLAAAPQFGLIGRSA
jgi:predicted nucleic acid-binding protein